MRILPVYSIDRPNGLERSRKVIFWTGPGAKVNECVRSIVSRFIKEEIHPIFSRAIR